MRERISEPHGLDAGASLGAEWRAALSLGAFLTASGVLFRAFCTTAERCTLRIFDAAGNPSRDVPMVAIRPGFFSIEDDQAGPGTLYKFVLDERELPDPYARFLPHGVHGPAMVVEPATGPRPAQVPLPLSESIIYELHVGTFTPEGTYRAAMQRLPELVELGVTTIELMPLSSFAGERGWGYEGVAHFAPHPAYGTPAELRAFVDRAHELGLSVLLDVIYNHFGPAGNYLSHYSPLYFTSAIHNAWGDALNFEFAVMRRYVLDNALYWLEEFALDGLRLDATHAILDPSRRHILRELALTVAERMPGRLLIAEDERNDPDLVREMGLHAIWADDFHHGVRVNLTGERDGYYSAYEPSAEQLAETINGGWLYTGQLYPPLRKLRGKPAGDLPAAAFVYCIQNHDQIGNRAMGDRLSEVVSLDAYCAASVLLLYLPMTPLLFMGQEWACSSPFIFFTDQEGELGRAISEGRQREFEHFAAFADAAVRGAIPDPQSESSFARSKLRWGEREQPEHARVLALYRKLLSLRRSHPTLRHSDRAQLRAVAMGRVLRVDRGRGERGLSLWMNLDATPVPLQRLQIDPSRVQLVLRSDGAEHLGHELPGHTAIVLGDAGVALDLL